MSRVLVAGVVSGAVGLSAWLIFALVAASLFDGLEELELLAGMLVMIPVALIRDDASGSIEGFLFSGTVVGVLVAAGHLTGVAIRPRLRPT